MASEAAAKAPGRRLAETVFVTDPSTHDTVLLQAGMEVRDPSLAEQITHPDAWAPYPGEAAETLGAPEDAQPTPLAAEEEQPAPSPTGDELPSAPRSGRRSRSTT